MANRFENLPKFEEILDNFVNNTFSDGIAFGEVTKDMLRRLYEDLKNSREETQERYINEMQS